MSEIAFVREGVCVHVHTCVCMRAYAAKATAWHENFTWNIILRFVEEP